MPISQIADFIYQLQDVGLSIKRMLDIQHLKNEDENKSLVLPIRINEDINISNLKFRYSGISSPYILKGLSLIIPYGIVTAIVGASGSGKTTLLKILLGIYDHYEGSITIGKNELRKIKPTEWKKKCGTVMQDGYIFTDTVERNITMSGEKTDKARLENAIELAALKEVFDDGILTLDTRIGYDGQGLSQGQKQRILIARMLYKNPQFIFLDEATNALDAKNEQRITNNLSNAFKNRTQIVIAHRLSTVRDADNIIVLKEGSIIEQGKHNELIALKGEYYQLVKAQLDLN